MRLSSRKQFIVAAMAFLGVLAVLQYWLAGHRPATLDRADVDLIVTSSFDRGPGSLREAIFRADTSAKRTRIVIRSPQPIRLETPLPPLVNPQGTIVEGETDRSEINAEAVDHGAVFDIASPHSLITRIKITKPPEQAVLARAPGVRLSRVAFSGCDVCVSVASGVNDFITEDSHFANNRVGIWLAADNAGIVIRNNQFRDHSDAAIWAVRGSSSEAPLSSGVQIRGNRFEADRLSLVLGNVSAAVDDNEFVQDRKSVV